MKARLMSMVGVLMAVLITASGCAVGEANPGGDESNAPIISKVEQINLYQDGEVSSLNELEGISGALLAVLQKLDLQALCVFSQERIDEIKQKDKVVELIFRDPVDIPISQFIEPEDRHHIATDENEYRILEKVKSAIFVLEDNLNEGLWAHVLVGSEYQGKIGYGCWAIKQKGSNELDKSWTDEVIKIISTEKMAKTAEQKLCEDTGGVWVNNRCLCPPGSTFTSEGCVAHSQYHPIDKIAKDYLLNSPTFKFDGIEDTLELVATNQGVCPYCWQFVFEFQCQHAGYGDRADQILLDVITLHTASITVEQGEAISAIMDDKWDMIKQKMIEKDSTGLPKPKTIQIVNREEVSLQ